MNKDSLGDRMKRYEGVPKNFLLRRTPVIIRLDGKAFHTWTKHLKNVDETLKDDPFSEVMVKCMAFTTRMLVENIQNAVIGYTQSDEISILLNDWKTLQTDAWFGNNVQKMTSVSASMATAYFNQAYDSEIGGMTSPPAMFDARVFNLPKEDVANYFVWRQQDATRNSIQMLGQQYFSHKELHKKNVSNIQDMLMADHEINWNDIDTWKKRGTCVKRMSLPSMKDGATFETIRPASSILLDKEIPIFTQDRNYIEDLLKTEETEK